MLLHFTFLYLFTWTLCSAQWGTDMGRLTCGDSKSGTITTSDTLHQYIFNPSIAYAKTFDTCSSSIDFDPIMYFYQASNGAYGGHCATGDAYGLTNEVCNTNKQRCTNTVGSSRDEIVFVTSDSGIEGDYQLDVTCWNPTAQPTKQPTSDPTTMNPTHFPTNIPTQTPTYIPTTSPTNVPTQTPSIYPTISPSNNPTVLPTNVPSTDPTSTPTMFPTDNPSRNPSSSPSLIPTVSPTKDPSDKPTIYSTIEPTLSPSQNPVILCPVGCVVYYPDQCNKCFCHDGAYQNTFCIHSQSCDLSAVMNEFCGSCESDTAQCDDGTLITRVADNLCHFEECTTESTAELFHIHFVLFICSFICVL
eukprot:156949_1